MALTQEQMDRIREHFRQKAAERQARHAAADEVLALKITYEEPAPDGTFEILFMTREEAVKFHQDRLTSGRWATSRDVIEEKTFAEGVALARRPDCCGGSYSLEEARRFQKINPVIKGLSLTI